MSIGQNIQRLRLQHGLSQNELASIAGVTNKAVSAWEKDRIVPRMGPIQRMADYFGIKKSDIIEPVQVTATFDVQRVISNNVLLNPKEAQLVYGYRELDTGKQQMLFNMLEFLKSPHSSNSMKIVQSNIGNNNSLNVGNNNSVTTA
ncbi:MAG: helix-turn-helix transcriptional regulator [Selenomonadaceae bacterium]|nr:helix-turn-helix transcriptional regulator [Selenomonadaceae bacterium]